MVWPPRPASQRVLGRVRAFEQELARLGLPVDHPARLAPRRAERTAIRAEIAALEQERIK